MRLHKIPVLNQIFTVLVSFVRGTPLLVQLYLSYYGVPIALRYWNYYNHTNFNINHVPAFLFVFVAFAINEAAYNSENIRGALLSVDDGEIEAAETLGMTLADPAAHHHSRSFGGGLADVGQSVHQLDQRHVVSLCRRRDRNDC
ncbi:ABC transporter permease subunit [Lacticaseibacillus manihotivorans]|uniref:ABC transporter permease subunit n=1 Tax=Lacticaseibacillus manihotivorans TaxID=88233 RepID=UPI001FB414AF|nr:ABC transporter permease subunit [Lacticaseibacillus manihotivorans]